MSELRWFVAHTKPRREKKLKQFCDGEGFPATLPCYRSVHKYRGKTVTFQKPLFPGYLFLQLTSIQRLKVVAHNSVANLLSVYDQELFARQLEEILLALTLNVEVYLAPQIGTGSRVKVRSGPLRGIEGCKLTNWN
jgi:transcription antitermination factor NusG